MDKQTQIDNDVKGDKEVDNSGDDKNLNEQKGVDAINDSDNTFEENSDSSDDVDNATTLGIP